jgi:hypothetical protein
LKASPANYEYTEAFQDQVAIDSTRRSGTKLSNYDLNQNALERKRATTRKYSPGNLQDNNFKKRFEALDQREQLRNHKKLPNRKTQRLCGGIFRNENDKNPFVSSPPMKKPCFSGEIVSSFPEQQFAKN